MDLQLKSKTAFISGSTQGIGYAIAKLLLSEGAIVVINGRTQQKLDDAVDRLKSEVPGAKVSGVIGDFADPNQVNRLISELPDIDILINNVGIFELGDFQTTSDEVWTKFFEVNVMSGVRMSRALFPAMSAKNWGRIVFISSEAGINVPENMIHYGMTKTAMLAVSNGLSGLTRNTGVTVNTILGGPTYSDGVADTVKQISTAQNVSVEQMKEGLMKTLNPSSLLQRFIEPSEIASMVAYLCSNASAATNGSAIRVDGGVLSTLM